MTEPVIAIPTTAPAPAPATSSNSAAAADAADTSANGQFQSALRQQLRDLTTAPAAAPAPAIPVNSAAATDAADASANVQFQSALQQQLQGLTTAPTPTPAVTATAAPAPAMPSNNAAEAAAADVSANGQLQSQLPGLTTAPAPAPAMSSASAAAAGAAALSAKGQCQSALRQHLHGLAETLSTAVPGAPSALLPSAAGDAKPVAAKSNQDGTDLPLSGQGLPLDPSLLAIVPPQAPPTSGELAASLLMMGNAAPGRGMNSAPPRLNLTPVASAVGQVAAAPGQTAHALPDLFAALMPQHEAVPAMHTAALAAELSAQPPTLSATAEQPAALTNVLATSAAPAQSVNAPASAVPAITIPVAHPGWDQALGQRVQWLVSQQLQGAELRITPPHLGPIDVRISIGQDQQTVVNFASPHAAVRDAIEAAVPRLRDMLGNNGQDLVNVNVSQHSFAEQRRQSAPSGTGRDNSYLGDLSVNAVDGAAGTAVLPRSGSGLVDYFA
jgi:flagellar hook-length control protein FliK